MSIVVTDSTFVDLPDVDGLVLAATCEEALSIATAGNTGDRPWMGDESHGLVWITIYRQLDDSHDLFRGLVGQVLVLEFGILVFWIDA